MKLSIIMPVFNEQHTIEKVIGEVQRQDLDKEIIIVEDYSTDKTKEILQKYTGAKGINIFFQPKNMGKGAAIREGLKHVKGDAVIIQDADLEYDPSEYRKLLAKMQETGAGAVYGSRFLSGKKVTSFWHYMVNKTLTVLTNILYGARLTDMETCYKLIKTDVIKSIDIRSDRFDIELELTAKLLKKGIKIQEASISYRGRGYHEGKKITWVDGLMTLAAMIKYRFKD